MPADAPNRVITVRGVRGGRQCYARNVEVHIFPASALALIEPNVAPKFKWALHWDPDDVIDDGTPTGSPWREGDVILWDQYPNQELALSSIREDWTGLDPDDYRLLTAYFMTVEQGEGGN